MVESGGWPGYLASQKDVDFNLGWKLHLNTGGSADDKNAKPDAVAFSKEIGDYLKSVGAKYKVGQNSGQTGKDLTIYVGSKDNARKAAQILHEKFGDRLLPKKGTDSDTSDVDFVGNVYGRFTGGTPRKTAGAEEIHQYGGKGIAFFNDDMREMLWGGGYNKEKAFQRAHDYFTKTHGEFYTGSQSSPEVKVPPKTESKTPSPDSETPDFVKLLRDYGKSIEPNYRVSSKKISSPTHKNVVRAIKNQQAGKQFSARALSNAGLINAYGGDTEIASLPNVVREHLQQAYGENFGSLKTLRDITKIGPEGKIEDSIFPEDPELAKERSEGLSAVSGQIPGLAGDLQAQKSAVDELQRKRNAFAALSGALNAFKAKSSAKDLSKRIHKSTASSLSNLFGDQVPATYGDIPDREMLAKMLADKGALEALGLTEADFSGTGNPFDAPYQRTKKAVERLHANTYDRFDPEGIGQTAMLANLSSDIGDRGEVPAELIFPDISQGLATSLLERAGRKDLAQEYAGAGEVERNAILSSAGFNASLNRPRNVFPKVDESRAGNRFEYAGTNNPAELERAAELNPELEAGRIEQRQAARRVRSVDRANKALAQGLPITSLGKDEKSSKQALGDVKQSIAGNVLDYMGLMAETSAQTAVGQVQIHLRDKDRAVAEIQGNLEGRLASTERSAGGRIDEENDNTPLEDMWSSQDDGNEMYFGSPDSEEIANFNTPLTGKELTQQKKNLTALEHHTKNYKLKNAKRIEKYISDLIDNSTFIEDLQKKYGSRLDINLIGREAALRYLNDITQENVVGGDVVSDIWNTGSPLRLPYLIENKEGEAKLRYADTLPAKSKRLSGLRDEAMAISKQLASGMKADLRSSIDALIQGKPRTKDPINKRETELARLNIGIWSDVEKAEVAKTYNHWKAVKDSFEEIRNSGEYNPMLSDDEAYINYNYERAKQMYDEYYPPENNVPTVNNMPVDATVNLSAAPSDIPDIGVIPGIKNAYWEWRDLQRKIDSGKATKQDAKMHGLLADMLHARSDAFESMLENVPASPDSKLTVQKTRRMGRLGDPEPSQQFKLEGFRMKEDVLAAAENYRRTAKQTAVHVLFSDVEPNTEIGHKYEDGSYNTSVISFGINKASAKLDQTVIQDMAFEAGLHGFNIDPESGKLELYYVGDRSVQDIDRWKNAVKQFYDKLSGAGISGNRGASFSDERDSVETKRLYDLNPQSDWATKELSNYQFGVSERRGGRSPIPGTREWARVAAAVEGLPEPDFETLGQSPLDPTLPSRVAAAYDQLPINDINNEAVASSYEALAKAVNRQYQYAPYEMSLGNFNYGNSNQMRADVINNGVLKTYQTTPSSFGPEGYDFSGHPFLEEMPFQVSSQNGGMITPVSNDVFRFVHDLLAHGTNPNQFGPVGEEAAYLTHAATLPYNAIPALATETRGQNSWVNFSQNPSANDPAMTVGEWNTKNRQNTEFAMQKAAIFSDPSLIMTKDEQINQQLADIYQDFLARGWIKKPESQAKLSRGLKRTR